MIDCDEQFVAGIRIGLHIVLCIKNNVFATQIATVHVQLFAESDGKDLLLQNTVNLLVARLHLNV